MRIQVEYDRDGRITALAGVGSIEFPDGETGSMGRTPAPDRHVMVTEVEEIRHERDFDGLRGLIEGYTVTGHPHEPRLARK